MGAEDPSRRATRIVVIDAHDVVHAGIVAWCAGADPAVEVLGTFSTPADFHLAEPMMESIDAVVMDLQIDGSKPDFEALRALCANDHRVVVFSDLAADEVILTSLDLGAATYVVKSEGRVHLMEAIQAARAAEPHLGPRMARALRNDSLLGRIRLSDREREVLIAWFQTESKEAVGERLFIAPTTVRTHLQRARAKYASIGRPAPTKSALLARAIEDGILSLQDL